MKRKLNLITIPNWTKDEENYLLKKGYKETSLLTKKSLISCRTKMSRLIKK